MAASSCVLSGGYLVPCKGIAGIQEIYIMAYNGSTASNGLGYTIGASASNLNQITAFTGATGSGFYQFQQELETGSVTPTANINPQNGTAYYDQVVEITVTNITQTLIDKVDTLGRGRWRILILDQNGNYFLVGKSNPVSVTGVTGGFGKALGDPQGFIITFTGKEYSVFTQVTTGAALSVITLAS